MAREKLVVMGAFDDIRDAEHAIANLIAVPIARDDVAVVAHPEAMPHRAHEAHVAPKSGAVATTAGMAMTLVGIALCAIPLAGLLTAPPLIILGGAAALVNARPDSPDALTELGVPRADAKIAVEHVRRGGIVLVVRTDRDRAHRAAEAMSRARSINLQTRADQWEASGWVFEPNAPMWTRERIHEDRALRLARASYAPTPDNDD